MRNDATEENPPAFPESGPLVSLPGMSLRDWFAGQVIGPIIHATSAGQHNPGDGHADDRPLHERMVSDAFKVADAMLAARGVS